MVGINYLLEAVEGLQTSRAAEFGRVAIGITVVSVVLKEAMARFAFWGCRRGDSGALRAEAWQHRGDSITWALLVAYIKQHFPQFGICVADYICTQLFFDNHDSYNFVERARESKRVQCRARVLGKRM